MKNLNVHILPTKDESHIIRFRTVLQFTDTPMKKSNPHHVYLTSDEDTKDGDWVHDSLRNCLWKKSEKITCNGEIYKKIVATTNLELGETLQGAPGGFKPLPPISKEDLPKIVENWNRDVKEVEYKRELWNAGHKTEHYRPILNDDGSINLAWRYGEGDNFGMFRVQKNMFLDKMYKDPVIQTYLKEQAELANGKLYTKEEVEKAFDESRLTHPLIGFKHETFEDYAKENLK